MKKFINLQDLINQLDTKCEFKNVITRYGLTKIKKKKDCEDYIKDNKDNLYL